MGLNGSPYHYIIAISRASLITSFQPPLPCASHDEQKREVLPFVWGSHEEHVSQHYQVTVYTISRWSCVCRKVLMTQQVPNKWGCSFVNWFYISLWASMAVQMITSSHSTNCYIPWALLITSFQPPLCQSWWTNKGALPFVWGSHVSKHCQVTVYTISRWSCVCRESADDTRTT